MLSKVAYVQSVFPPEAHIYVHHAILYVAGFTEKQAVSTRSELHLGLREDNTLDRAGSTLHRQKPATYKKSSVNVDW